MTPGEVRRALGEVRRAPRAVLYLPDAASVAAAVLPVAGRPAIVRTLMAAVRAGIPCIGVPRRLRNDLEDLLRPYPQLSDAIEWLSPATPPWTHGSVLLLPAAALVDAATLRTLIDASPAPAGAALGAANGTRLGVAVAAPALVAMLWPRLADGQPCGADLAHGLRGGDVAFVPAGFLLPVLDERQSREAEAALYARLGIAADSPIDRHLHRRCSRALTRLLVRSPVTPNHVTLASLAVGVAAAGCVWRARSPRLAGLGLLLYATSVVIDHADGDLARITFQESTFGERLDFACDTVVHAALVLAMGATARREAGAGALLGAAAAAGVVLSAVVARFLPPRRDGGLGPLLRGLGNRDLFYAMLAAFTSGLGGARRALPWVMAVLAAGSQAYWLAGVAQRLREGTEQA